MTLDRPLRLGTRGSPLALVQANMVADALRAAHGWSADAIAIVPVKATGDGVILHAEWGGQYGKLVVIDHGNGIQTYYAHLSGFSVVAGQAIRRGDIVGYSGMTGKASGPHLHYEVRRGGIPMNPSKYLNSTQAAATSPVQKEFPF